MKELKNNCHRTEIFISPKNYKQLRKKEDLQKQWSVECRFFDPIFSSKYPKGFQYRIRMNSFDTIAERKIAVETIKEEMEKKLDLHHYNPITKTYMTSNSEELNPNLFIEEALSIARTKLNGSEYHLNRIKADLIRIGKSIQSLGYDTLLIKDVKIWHIKNILENMGLTPSAFNKVRQYMLSLFKELIQYGCIEYNPVRDIEKKVEVAKLREILPDEKFRVLFKYLKENHYEFYRYAMIFYYSGARSAELLRVQRKHINIERLCISNRCL